MTGSSGFIGKNLMPKLPKDWEIYIVKHDHEFIESLSMPDEYDLCIHLAGNSDPNLSVEIPADDLDANTGYLIALLETFIIRRFVYFSSGAVYDGNIGPVSPATPLNPKLPYAISKYASEQYLKFYKEKGRIENFNIIRFFGAYGPHESERKIYTRLVRQFGINRNPEFIIKGNGENLVDAMYIDDAIRAILQIINYNNCPEVFDLYAGDAITIRGLAEFAGILFGIQPKIKYEGKTAECIHFNSIDSSFPFRPIITLKEGLLKLRNWLTRQKERHKCLQ